MSAENKDVLKEITETTLEQFVDKVIDYTARYNSVKHTSYSPQNLVGKYSKYPCYGDFPETYTLRSYGTWWNCEESHQRCYMPQDPDPSGVEDYVTVHFDKAVLPLGIHIYETYSPGCVVRIWGRQKEQKWCLLWQGPPQEYPNKARIFDPAINKVNYFVNEIRLELNCSRLKHHPCFDAILLYGHPAKSLLQQKLFGMLRTTKENNEDMCHDTLYIDNGINNDSFSNLPHEVILHIFQYLDLRTLSNCALVNKRWNAVTYDPVLYQNLSLKRYWHRVDSKTLIYFLERSRNLKKLDLSWCGNHDLDFAKTFSRFFDICCKNLTHLSLGNCSFINDDHIELISECVDLIELRLRQVGPVGIFFPLHKLNKLVALDLYSSSITDDELLVILEANLHLKHINLDFCEKLERLDEVVEVVATRDNNLLSWSSWKTRSLTSVGVGYFSLCPQLQELDLGWCLLLNQPGDALEKIAVECTVLRRLIISGWRGVTDQVLVPILDNCKQLRQLDLLGIKSISKDICEMALMTLPNLQLLEISYCDSIPNERVNSWRCKYPAVTIQRSCEF